MGWDVAQAGGPILLRAILAGASYQLGFAVIGGLVLVAVAAFALVARPVAVAEPYG